MKRYTILLKLFFIICYAFPQSPQLGWSRAFGGSEVDFARAVEVDTSGNIYMAGFFEGSVDFDPSAGANILSAAPGERDVFIQKLTPSGDLLWVKQISAGSRIDTVIDKIIQVDLAGNVYLSASFRGMVDFDPGPGNFILNSTTVFDYDFFLLKLDSSGNFLWATQTGAQQNEIFSTIALDDSSNIIRMGYFYGTIDFDPGPGDFSITASSGGDIFFQKLDSAANFLWAKSLGNSEQNYIGALRTDARGNIIASGSFKNSMDFDPGVGTFMLNALNLSYDIFTLKLSPEGNLLWASQIQSENSEFHSNLEVNTQGEIYCTASFSGSLDLDPGPAVYGLTSSNNGLNFDGFLQKLDSLGNFIWGKQFSGTAGNFSSFYPQFIRFDADEYIYLNGYVWGEVDFDPGPGMSIAGGPNDKANFLLKLTDNADLIWSRTFGKDIPELVKDLVIDKEEAIYLAGRLGAAWDIDPGPGIAYLRSPNQNSDIFLLKWEQDSCLGFRLAIDSVNNIQCGISGLIASHGEGGLAPYTYIWNPNPLGQDSILRSFDPGIYALMISDSLNCSTGTNVYLPGPEYQNQRDMGVNLILPSLRAGRRQTAFLEARNNGCVSDSLSLKFVMSDPRISIHSVSPPAQFIQGDTLVWTKNDFDYDEGLLRVALNLDVSVPPSNLSNACFWAKAEAFSGDVDPSNNEQMICKPILNSYDPNDIQVYPAGHCEQGYILNDQLLSYKIRFQNTGNADALNIFILDSLDTDLDLESFRLLGQSHDPLIVELLPDRVLKFSFDNIHLPDSSSDEPNSHGYILYEIAPEDSLIAGTEIFNRAGIYFDFNEVVLTNTVRNTIIDQLPRLDTAYLEANSCDSFRLNEISYEHSGLFYQYLSGMDNCDSVLVLDLQIEQIENGIEQIGGSLQAIEEGASYQWLDCDQGNLPIANATNRSFSPSQNGNYAVQIIKGACSEISDCINMTRLAIDKDFQKQLKLYPNPTRDELRLEFLSIQKELEIRIYNYAGLLLQKEVFEEIESTRISLPRAAGIYIIELIGENQRSLHKIWKQK